MFSPWFVTVMTTLGMTAPLGSVTVPRMVPKVDCPNEGRVSTNKARKATTTTEGFALMPHFLSADFWARSSQCPGDENGFIANFASAYVSSTLPVKSNECLLRNSRVEINALGTPASGDVNLQIYASPACDFGLDFRTSLVGTRRPASSGGRYGFSS